MTISVFVRGKKIIESRYNKMLKNTFILSIAVPYRTMKKLTGN
jgi:hypothetical protein